MVTRYKTLNRTEVTRTSAKSKQINRNLFTEVSPIHAMELKDYQFPKDLENQIYSLSLTKDASASEVVQMVLRNHFSLPVPEKWKPDTDLWITSAVDIVY